MAINSKNKGNRNERDLCKFWEEWTGYEFSRVPASGALRWKKTDNISGDIICSDPDHSRVFPFNIETKFHQDINFQHLLIPVTNVKIKEFWAQATEDADRAKKTPILFMRYNGLPKGFWFVVMDFKLFLQIRKFGKPGKSLRFKDPQSNYDISIISSTELKNLPYEKIIKTF